MTIEEAYQILLISESDKNNQAVISASFKELFNEFQMRITNAPTEGLRNTYKNKLSEIESAFNRLTEQNSIDDNAELPQSGKRFEEPVTNSPHILDSKAEVETDENHSDIWQLLNLPKNASVASVSKAYAKRNKELQKIIQSGNERLVMVAKKEIELLQNAFNKSSIKVPSKRRNMLFAILASVFVLVIILYIKSDTDLNNYDSELVEYDMDEEEEEISEEALEDEIDVKKTTESSTISEIHLYNLTDEYGNIFDYYGEVKNGKPHGVGNATYKSGSVYVGEWKDGKEHGQGTIFNINGEYVGEFKNGFYNGQGTYSWHNGDHNGDKYVGEWKDGMFNGQGTYTWPNGDKYVGEWKDDEKHGSGILYSSNGTFEKQVWENGKQKN